MKSTKLFLAILIFIGIVSCSKKGPELEPDENGTENTLGVKEHTVGYVRNGLKKQPALWKDGTLTVLPFTEALNAEAEKIVVSGKDTYILGHERSSNGFNRTSTILLWKNEILTRITDGSQKAFPLKLIVNDGNVYVLGTETDQSEGSAITIYKYWKNGVPITLNTLNGEATDMVVVNNDVYISGSEVNALGQKTAKFWKNGVATEISNPNLNAYGLSIAVSGSEVSLLFMEKSLITTMYDLKLWKNSAITTLVSESNYFDFKIIIKDNVTHIMAIQRETPGSDNQSPRVVYWKNGTKSNITDGSRTASNAKMVINDNDVFIGFHEYNSNNNGVVKLSKNGTLQSLSSANDNMSATGLSVGSSGEYMVGNNTTAAFQWKNGIQKNISLNGYINDIFVK